MMMRMLGRMRDRKGKRRLRKRLLKIHWLIQVKFQKLMKSTGVRKWRMRNLNKSRRNNQWPLFQLIRPIQRRRL